MKIGKVLAKWRLLNDLTVREFGDELKISAPTLCRIENGYEMDVSTFKKIMDWLMTDDKERGKNGKRGYQVSKSHAEKAAMSVESRKGKEAGS